MRDASTTTREFVRGVDCPVLVVGADVVGKIRPDALYVCTHKRTLEGLKTCKIEDVLSQCKYDKFLSTIMAFWLDPPDCMPAKANSWVRKMISEIACDDSSDGQCAFITEIGSDTLPRVLLDHAHLCLNPRKLPGNFDAVVMSMTHGRHHRIIDHATWFHPILPSNDVRTDLVMLRRLALMPEMIGNLTKEENRANLLFALEITRAPKCLLSREKAQSALAAYCMLAFRILQEHIRQKRKLKNAFERSNELKDAYERFNEFATVLWCMKNPANSTDHSLCRCSYPSGSKHEEADYGHWSESYMQC